jgi:hypothetical protein
MNKITITSLFVSAVLITSAWAGTPRDHAGRQSESAPDPKNLPMETVDTNSDGSISREEAFGNEKVSKYWDKLDKDLDGLLNRAEFSRLEEVVNFEEARKTDHPVDVQQYEDGEYISPNEQIERNQREGSSGKRFD